MPDNEWPRMAACLLTYQRTEYAVRTVNSVCDRLKYPNLAWYVADDGSDPPHFFSVLAALEDKGAMVFGSHSEKFGAGKSWNRAVQQALEHCDLLVNLEDDWELMADLDVRPFVKLLLEKTEVGMIRLGGLPVGLDLHSVGYDGIHYLRVEPTTSYQWSGNPSIRHRSFAEFYGSFPEGKSPGDTEVAYDAQVRKKPGGPEIWWPLQVGGYGIFAHIGQEQSY